MAKQLRKGVKPGKKEVKVCGDCENFSSVVRGSSPWKSPSSFRGNYVEREYLEFIQHKSADMVLFPGDFVMMQAEDPNQPPYVAQIKRIRSDLQLEICWLYRPEETTKGREYFHGKKELLLSDHHDIQNPEVVERKCNVYTLIEYMELKHAQPDDFFWRLKYKHRTCQVTPKNLPLYCVCRSHYNPDLCMVKCTGCHEWLHLDCLDIVTPEEKFSCPFCSLRAT